jgi:sugar/nucleoside kinase (ribokinase family)
VVIVDLVCVGDVMLDIRVDAETLKRGGDVHGTVLLQPGGTSSNAAVWAAWSGARSRVHGRVGDDLIGRTLREELEGRGVETALTLDREASTGTMLILHEPGERSMVADRGANDRLSPGDLPDQLSAGAVLVSGYLFLQDAGHDAAVESLGRARAGFVAIEAASWPLVEAFGSDRFIDESTQLGANALLANGSEARALTGLDGAAAASALGHRFRLVAIKLGGLGAVVVLDGERRTVSAKPVDEIDPTGAGDAFDGVLLGSLARGVALDEAIDLASTAGSIVAASAGVWPATGSASP